MKIQSDVNYPKMVRIVTHTGFQVGVILLTLFLVIYYNAAYYLYVPLTGVWISYVDDSLTSTQIERIDTGSPGDITGLKQGDRIVSIDGRIITNLNSPLHNFKKAGETELYVVERAGQELKFSVVVGDYLRNPAYLLDVVPSQLLSLLIYFLGVLLFLFSAAQDIRARLVGMTWFLSGVLLAVTISGYPSCAWFASDLTFITMAFCSFFSLAAHLYFPVTTFSNRTRNIILWSMLGLSLLLMAAYVLQSITFQTNDLPPEISQSAKLIEYFFPLVWLANIGLLIKNRFIARGKEIRRQTNIVLIGTLIGFLPFLLLTELPFFLFGPKFIILPSNISTLSLIFIPLSYGYVIYQRKLLKIDLIINRALVLFLLVVLILFASETILGIISILLNLPSQIVVVCGILCVVVALSSASLQKRIQIQVDRVLYGGSYDFTSVTTRLSSRLSQITNRHDFEEILTTEFSQQMQIEKSALLMVHNGYIELRNSDGLSFSAPVGDDGICKLLVHAYLSVHAANLWALVSTETAEKWAMFGWVQVFAPIAHGDVLYGILVLGDRSTGNIYSSQDMQIINMISQQAALAIANIATVESLRGLTQQLVRTDEEQRRVVASELHDDILQNLFFLQVKLAETNPDLASHLQKTVVRLRQTIKAQRPSLLDQGIVLALQDLISDLNQLAEGKTIIRLRNLLPEAITLDDDRTTALYRLVQEALSNVLKHADADEAVVTLKRDHDVLQIEIKDNGIGMENTISQVQSGHYGLLGMTERATMIGAALNIASELENGTVVSVRLKM
jgi:signal transduction histidine kinase